MQPLRPRDRVTRAPAVCLAVAALVACGGSRPPITGPPVGARDGDLLARIAVRAAACHGRSPSTWMGDMTTTVRTGYEGLALRAGRCLAFDDHGCDAFERCTGLRHSPAPNRSACSGAHRCDADVLSYCADETRVTIDCGVSGLRCASGDCMAPEEGQPCDARTFASRCEGGRAVACESGVVRRSPVCADAGLVCGASPVSHGQMTCRGAGVDCEGDFMEHGYDLSRAYSCDAAGRPVACVNGGMHAIDCTFLDPAARCSPRAAKPGFELQRFECRVPNGCDESVEAPRCEGDAVAFCSAGRRLRVSCAALGFAACDGGRCR